MSDVYKTTEPLMCGDDYVFPPTVMSQVKLDEDLTKDAGAVVVRNDRDVLTLEEIQASSPEMLAGKVPSAEAFSELNNNVNSLNTTIKSTQQDQNLYVNTTGEYLYSTGKSFNIPRNGVLIIYFYKEYVGNTIFVYHNGIRKGTFANYLCANVYGTLQLNVTAGDIITVNTDVESSEIHLNYKLLQVTLI